MSEDLLMKARIMCHIANASEYCYERGSGGIYLVHRNGGKGELPATEQLLDEAIIVNKRLAGLVMGGER